MRYNPLHLEVLASITIGAERVLQPEGKPSSVLWKMSRNNPFEQGFPNGTAFLEDSVRLYQQVNLGNKGQMVCLAGEPGSGRTDFLKRLGSYLVRHSPRPALVYGLSPQDEASLWPTVKKAFLPLAGVSTWIGGFIKSSDGGFTELAGQTYEAIKTVGDAFSSPSPNDPEAQLEQVKTYIRDVAQKRTVIWVFPNLDKQTSLWTTIVGEIAREFVNEYRVLLFISLEGPRQFDQIDLTDSDCLQVLRSFVKQGTAHWWYLSPLTKKEIDQSMGPMTPALLSFIFELSGGKPQLLLDLWTLLYENNLIVQTDSNRSWTLDPGWERQRETKELSALKDILRKRVRGAIGSQSNPYFDDVWNLLKYAALEGLEFTAEAVLQMWQENQNRPILTPGTSSTITNEKLGSTDQNREKLFFLLDKILAKTEEQPAGLFLPKAIVEINKASGDQPNFEQYSVSLKKYKFAHPIFHTLVSRNSWFDKMERPAKIHQLIDVLTKLYEPELHYIYPALATLYKELGNQRMAGDYQRKHNLRSSWQELTLHARILSRISTARWELREYKRGVAILRSFLARNVNRIEVDEALNIANIGMEWAEKIPDKEAGSFFTLNKGYAYWLKRELDHASSCYSSVVLQTQEKKNNVLKFQSLLGLSRIEREKKNFDKARSYLEEAKKPANLIDDYRCRGEFFLDYAVLEKKLNNFVRAEELAKDSLSFFHKAGTLQNICDTYEQLGFICRYQNRYKEAYSYGVETIRFARKAGSLARESHGWNLLSIVCMAVGETSLGLQTTRKSYELVRGQNSEDTFTQLGNLGNGLCKRGRNKDGLILVGLSALLKRKTKIETLEEMRSVLLNCPPEEILSQENVSQLFSGIEVQFEKDMGNTLIDKILSSIVPPEDSIFLNDAKWFHNVKPSDSNS